MYRGMREVDAPGYSEGGRREVEIQKRNIVSAHILRTDYDWEVVGGTGAGGLLTRPSYWFYRALKVEAGGDTLHDVNGHTLGSMVKLLFPEELAQTPPTSVAAAADEDDRVARILVPYFMIRSLTADDGALPTPAAEPRFIVDYATADELVTTAQDGTPGFTGTPSTRLFEHPLKGAAARPFAKWDAVSVRKVRKEVNQSGAITVNLNHLRNGMGLRLVMVEALSGGSDGKGHEFNDDLVSTVGPLDLDGDQPWEQVPFDEIQARNKVEYQLASTEPGVAVLDFAEDQRTRRGSLPIVTGEEKPFLKLDVATQSGEEEVIVTTVAVARGRRPGGNGRGRS